MADYQSIFTGNELDGRLVAVAQLQDALAQLEGALNAKYNKPATGIPAADLDAAVNAALAKANSAVQSLADYYTKSEVDALLAAINSEEYVTVTTLPTAGTDTLGKIYLVGPTSGEYARFITTMDGSTFGWVQIGTTDVDLSGYATKQDLEALQVPPTNKRILSNNILDLNTMISANTRLLRKDNGEPTTSGPGFGYTDFIPIPPEGLRCNNCYTGDGVYGTRMVYYDAYKQFIGYNNGSQYATWAEGRAYVRFNLGDPVAFEDGHSHAGENYAVYLGTELKTYDVYEAYNQVPTEGLEDEAVTTPKIKDGAVSLQKTDFSEMKEPKNLLDLTKLTTSRWVNSTGGISTVAATYGYINYTPVKPNTTYHCSNKTDSALSNRSDAYIAFYNENKGFLSSVASNRKSFTTPDGAAFVRISVVVARLTEAQLEEGEARTAYSEYFAPYPVLAPEIIEIGDNAVTTEKVKDGAITQEKLADTVHFPATPPRFTGFKAASSSLEPEAQLTTDLVYVSKNIRIVAEIDGGIESVSVGVARNGTYGKWVEITPTKLILRGGSSGEASNEYTHGLTLGTKTKLVISRTVTSGSQASAIVRLVDDYGNIFSQSVSWGTVVGRAFVYNGNATDAVAARLSFMLGDITKNIWLFGDSYFSYGDASRWPYYTINWGYLSYLMNARGGENATEALADFQTLLALGYRPSFVVWCMGMNGGADSNGSVNSSWLSITQQMLSLCESYGITAILSTIPSVPTQIHEALNTWVRNSGYRYVDIAAAVETGVADNYTWRGWGTSNALLSSDQVHPTSHGAAEMALRVLLDFPELSIKED